ncbi:hypothetical protein RRG08_006627 [Elysia crispata]|uniref:Uncharacterized protein n=1 Tax=Elysia crispata TaxID=231223 RepID=A0AAE0YVI4_9GAST|nr:hypothetical protein RRG08_006627 [Elysia crispata]
MHRIEERKKKCPEHSILATSKFQHGNLRPPCLAPIFPRCRARRAFSLCYIGYLWRETTRLVIALFRLNSRQVARSHVLALLIVNGHSSSCISLLAKTIELSLSPAPSSSSLSNDNISPIREFCPKLTVFVTTDRSEKLGTGNIAARRAIEWAGLSWHRTRCANQ